MYSRMGYTYERLPGHTVQTGPVSRQLRGMAAGLNPALAGLSQDAPSGTPAPAVKPAAAGVLALGGLVSLGLGVSSALFYYGVARESRSKMVKATGYLASAVGGLGVVLGLVGLGMGVSKAAGIGAPPEEQFMGAPPEEQFMGRW